MEKDRPLDFVFNFMLLVSFSALGAFEQHFLVTCSCVQLVRIKMNFALWHRSVETRYIIHG